MRALQHGVSAGRCARRSTLVCAASGKQLTGACVVTLTSRHATSCKVQRSAENDAGLQDYMSRAADNFALGCSHTSNSWKRGTTSSTLELSTLLILPPRGS